MLVNTYGQNGEKTGQTRLPPEIFDVKMNPDLVHQVVVAQMGNRRRVIAHTKTKDEVRGGGRKPWKQKHTGRARHGSIRSPIWRKGGIIFGPRKERVYKQKINEKMKKRALLMVLSSKVRDNELIILEDFKIEKPKTKIIAEILSKLPSKEKSILIALPHKDENIIRASRNIPKTQSIEVRNLNVLDLLNFKYLLMLKETIGVIKTTFLKSK